jgi:hypothetical protein
MTNRISTLQQRTTSCAVGVLLPAGALQPSPLDDLAFSKKPRPVEFQPYSLVSGKGHCS